MILHYKFIRANMSTPSSHVETYAHVQICVSSIMNCSYANQKGSVIKGSNFRVGFSITKKKQIDSVWNFLQSPKQVRGSCVNSLF